MKRHSRQLLRNVRLTAIALATLSTQATAATQTWDDGQANLTWDTATSTNWDAGSTWTAGNDADFGAVGVGSITIATGGVAAHNLTFSTTGYSISGAALTLNGTTPTITTDPGVTATILSVIAGTNGLIKAGDGTLALSGVNTFTGALVINAGTLSATTSAAALGAGTLTLNGGSLDFNHSAALNFARNTTVGGNATIISEKDVAGAGVTYTLGTLAIGAQTLTAGGGNVTSGTAGLTFGATTLSGAATFEILKPVGGGTTLLTLAAITGGANTVTLKGDGNFAQSGVWAGTGSGLTLDSTYTGTATLNLANTYTGAVTLNGGTLKANGNAGALGTGVATLVLNGGTLDFNHSAALNFARNTTVGGNATIISEKNTAGAGVTYTLGTLAIGAQTLTVSGGNVTSGTAGLTFGATTLSGAATFEILKPVGGGTTLLTLAAITGGANTVTLKGDGNFAQSGVWAGTGSGLTLASTYTGTATLNQANTFTGKTTISGGTLSINTLKNVSGGASALGAPTTVADGTIDMAGILTYTGAATSSDRVINLTGASTLTNSGAALTLTGGISGTGNLLIRGAQATTESGLLDFTGTLTRTDASTLTLSNAANSFGDVTISQGTISVNSIANAGLASALGAGNTITLGQSGFNNIGTLQFTGASGGSSNRSITILSNSGNTNGGTIENTVAGQTLTLGGNVTIGGTGTTPSLQLTGAGNGEMSGNISGTGLAVTKTGAGTWTLSGTNSHTGGTTITTGVLQLNNTLALQNSPVTLNTGTTLRLRSDANATFTMASLATGTGGNQTIDVGALTLGNIDKVLTLPDLNMSLSSTTLNITNSSADGYSAAFGAVNTGNTGLTISSACASSFASFTASNTGRVNTLTFTGVGTTTVGTINNSPTHAVAVTVNKASNGKLILTGANTYTGNTIVSAGTLVLSGTNAVSTGYWNPIGATAVLSINSLAAINNGATAAGAYLAIQNGGTFRYTGTGAETSTKVLYWNVGSATVEITEATANLTWNPTGGTLSQAFTKTGAGTFTLGGAITGGTMTVNGGTMVLNGANTSTGATTISAGKLEIGGAGVLGSGAYAGNIANSGTFSYNSTAAQTLSGIISGAGVLTKTGSGTLTLTGVNTYTGTTTLSNGTLAIGGAGQLNSGNYAADITNDGLINYNSTATQTLGGTISGTGALTVSAGRLILTGTNTYDGMTTVNSGATLGGTGSVKKGTVNLGGHLAPGASVGTTTFAELTLNLGSILDFEFDGGTPANDQIVVTGTNGLTLNGGTFNLYDVGTTNKAVLVSGTPYNLIQYSGTPGGAGLPVLGVANPEDGKGYSFGTSGGWVTLTATTGKAWVSGTTDDKWQTADNWGGTAPVAGDVLVFGSGARTTPDNDFISGTSFGGIVFNSTTTGFTLIGNAIALTGAVSNNGTGTNTINLGMDLAAGSGAFNTVGGNLAIGGIISGSQQVTKFGTGTLTLNGVNTYTGNTTISAGTLAIGGAGQLGSGTYAGNISNAGTLNVNSTAAQTLSGIISGAGALTKANTGTLTLSGANTYTGATTLSGGTLALSGGDNRINTANTVTFAGASTLNLGSTSQSLANLNFSANVTGTVTGSGGTLTLTGASVNLGGQGNTTLDATGLTNFIYNNAAGTLSLTPSANNTTPTLKLGANATITASLFQLAASGPSGATVSSNATAYLGQTTTLNADTIRVYAASSQSGTGTLRYNAGLTAPTLTIRGSAGGTTRATTVVIGGVGMTGSSNYAGGTGFVLLTAADSILDAMVTNLTIGSRQGLSGSAKNAAGTFEFNLGTLDATTIKVGNNSSSGATATGTLTVNGGTVKVTTLTLASAGTSAGNFNINSGANVYAQTINNGAGATRTINWNNGTIHNYDATTDLTLGGTTTFALAGAGTLHAFNIDSARTGTVNSVMSGVGSLTKLGDGTLTLAGTNTYTGSTTLTAGTLSVATIGNGGVAGNLGAATAVATNLVFDGGTLQYTGATAGTDRNFTINAGKTAIIDVFNGANTLTINGASTVTTGGLTKTGAGTLALTGTNLHTGDTTVTAGILAVDGDAIADAAKLVINGGRVAPTGTEVVAVLDFGSGPVANGTYGATGSGATNIDDIHFTGSAGVVHVGPVGTTYDSWATDKGLTGLDKLPGADPDHDGIPNSVEMVLGGDPKTGMDTALLPTIELVNADPDNDTVSTDYLLFTYRRTKVSEDAGVLPVCETSTTLAAPWTIVTNVSPNVILTDEPFAWTNPVAPADTDRVRVYVPLGSNTTLFGRLNVVVP